MMMNKQTTTAVTGIAMAMAAGTAAYMLTQHKPSHSMSKQLKRNAGKAMKTLGSVLNSVEGMMR